VGRRRRETNFVLYELEGIEDSDGDCAAVIDSIENFVADYHHLDPLLDKSPPILVPAAHSNGRNAVVTPPETKELVAAFKERGFVQLGELGLPFAAQCSAAFTLCSAFSSNPFGVFTLTRCAADLLEAHGSDALKAEFLPKMRSAEWLGTMALSEPQAGSSLSAIRTIATPYTAPDALPGEFRIRGDKMWTSGAFHDLSDNIIHMLLARTPDAPAGAAGISLFLVPNVLADGSHNDVEIIGLNRKMGHKALSNCAWSLGDRTGGAVGYLVGERHVGREGCDTGGSGPGRRTDGNV
jgi:alkylation response protein AidB-like acyl-CoA dehydrogenase